MKRIFVIVFILLVAGLGLTFTALNAGSVQLDYYFGAGEFPLSLVMAGALILGAVIGIIGCSGKMLAMKREMSRLRRELRLNEREVSNLRALPMQDSR